MLNRLHQTRSIACHRRAPLLHELHLWHLPVRGDLDVLRRALDNPLAGALVPDPERDGGLQRHGPLQLRLRLVVSSWAVVT